MLHFFLIESNYKKKSQIEKLIYEFGVSETKNEKLIWKIYSIFELYWLIKIL